MTLASFRGDFAYDFILFLHILTAIVGFGSTFVWPMLAAQARQLPPAQGYAMTHANLGASKILSSYFIYAVGITGVILVLMSDLTDFSDAWISIALLLYIGAIAISVGLHYPNLKAMDTIQEKLVSGNADAPSAGGPPPEVGELQERGKKAGMYGGILHLLFLVILVDMIWKPGADTPFG